MVTSTAERFNSLLKMYHVRTDRRVALPVSTYRRQFSGIAFYCVESSRVYLHARTVSGEREK